MTQVPGPSQRPVDAPVVLGDASTPDSPPAGQSAVSATHPETSVRDRIARALREHGTPLPDDGYPADEYECCADHLLADMELLDALVAYLHQRRLPFAYIVMDANTVMVPKGMRNVDLVSTREEAEDILADREEQAIADAQWHKGTRYLIGEIHPVCDMKGEL